MSKEAAQVEVRGRHGIPSLSELKSGVRRADFLVFLVMLVLALVGAGVSQAEDQGRILRLYWFGLIGLGPVGYRMVRDHRVPSERRGGGLPRTGCTANG